MTYCLIDELTGRNEHWTINASDVLSFARQVAVAMVSITRDLFTIAKLLFPKLSFILVILEVLEQNQMSFANTQYSDITLYVKTLVVLEWFKCMAHGARSICRDETLCIVTWLLATCCWATTRWWKCATLGLLELCTLETSTVSWQADVCHSSGWRSSRSETASSQHIVTSGHSASYSGRSSPWVRHSSLHTYDLLTAYSNDSDSRINCDAIRSPACVYTVSQKSTTPNSRW